MMETGDGNILQDLDIESILQCPVCYEIPPKVIFMCKVGHHMCERCRLRLTTCPTCKSAITGTRNFLGESLTNMLSVLLKGSGEDANTNVDRNLDDAINGIILQGLTNKRMITNDNPLKRLPNPGGVYKCLLESCPQRDSMGVGHMFAHLQNLHTPMFDKFQNRTATFKNKFENFCFRNRTSKFHRAMHVTNMGLFFLMIECVSGSYLHCWISTPAQSRSANAFHCELVFCKEGSNIRWIFRNKVSSNLLGKGQMFDMGRIFVIPPEDHELKNGDFFSFKVKIVYKPSDSRS